MSLPFVHTARRSYRSDKLVIELDEELGCLKITLRLRFAN